MAKVKTTRYYLPIFGSIQRKMVQTSGDTNNPRSTDALEYEFRDDLEFFNHFRVLKIKTVGGVLEKGNTKIGIYERGGAERRDRPRSRINSEKFIDKKEQRTK